MSEPDDLLEMTDHAARESRIGAMKVQGAEKPIFGDGRNPCCKENMT